MNTSSPSDCLTRFKRAVSAARRGDFSLCRGLVDRVRDAFGEAAAQIQRRELKRYIDSEERA
jgi:hypothetical protein